MPKISVIMGIYNCEGTLGKSIESILAQTYGDWELIMCDDGSSDNTYHIAKYYANLYPEKIFLYKNRKNKGLSYTLNKCMKRAHGEYIARQDGDDYSHIERFRKEADFLDNHLEFSIVGCNVNFLDETGIWGYTKFSGIVKKEDFIYGTPFSHPTVMIRKDAILDVGGYSNTKYLLRVEDYHLWLKMYIKGYIGFNLNEIMYDYTDDRMAMLRRTPINRVNLFRLMLWGYRQLGIPYRYYCIPFKHIVMMVIPKKLYSIIHRRKWECELDN